MVRHSSFYTLTQYANVKVFQLFTKVGIDLQAFGESPLW